MITPYGGERLPIYVWTPRNVTPPFQTVIYFPGASAFYSFSSIDQWPGRTREVFVKSGRALVLPVYKGTFERRTSPPGYPDTTEGWRDHLIQMSKDLGRALDWLETRSEFDMRKVAFAGSSQGALYAPFLVAVEPRIQAAILIAGGMWSSPPPLPETDAVHYAPRVKVPVIMLNGSITGGRRASIGIRLSSSARSKSRSFNYERSRTYEYAFPPG